MRIPVFHLLVGGEMKVLPVPSCWERFSISLDLNPVSLSECNILGKPNFSMVSKNNFFATVIVFLSFNGVVIR